MRNVVQIQGRVISDTKLVFEFVDDFENVTHSPDNRSHAAHEIHKPVSQGWSVRRWDSRDPLEESAHHRGPVASLGSGLG